jgi:hypothetical protein
MRPVNLEDTIAYISSIADQINYQEMELVPLVAIMYTKITYACEQLATVLLKNANTLKIGVFDYFIEDYKQLLKVYLKVHLSTPVIKYIESQEDWCFPKNSYSLAQFMNEDFIEFVDYPPARLDNLIDYINGTMLQILVGINNMIRYEDKVKSAIIAEKDTEIENRNHFIRVPPRKKRRLSPTDILFYEED